ncbi:MAG: endonuclease/exonuclease/phosphatase family protein [Planctomycetota bacterium]
MNTDHDERDPAAAIAEIQKGRSLICKLAIFGSYVTLALFLFAQLGRWFFLAELLGNFRIQMFALTLFAGVVSLLVAQKWLGRILLFVTAWNATLLGVIFWPATQPPAGPESLKIMSFNVLAAANDYETVVQRVNEVSPDVVTIIEYDHNWYHALDGLNETYPHQLLDPRWHGFGIAIFSRLPLKNPRTHQLINEVTDAPMIVAEVDVGTRSLRIASIHVLSPTSRKRMDLRNRQFEEIAEILNQDSIPTIVLGDFNCTPWSPFLNDFVQATGYRDSRQGFGIQPTWHREYWPSMIPIDNAFVSEQVHIHSRHVNEGSMSDHFPIVLEVSISDETIQQQNE